MKNNKGLSLVEVLITVTILAIVIISAVAFMATGSRSFARGSADSNVQSEAELAVNQIEDLILDVNGGIDFQTTSGGGELTMYHAEPDDSGLTTYQKRSVVWDSGNEDLKSTEEVVDRDDATGSYSVSSVTYTGQLLAENVTDFDVDLSDFYEETDKNGVVHKIVRSVVITVKCLDATGNASYATSPVITLRNRLMIGSNMDEIFEETPTPEDNLTLYYADNGAGISAALPIIDGVSEVERDKVYDIYAIVNLGSHVNDRCDWEVEGLNSLAISTIDSSGMLSVDENEMNDYLRVTATYKNNTGKKATGVLKVVGGNVHDKLYKVKIQPTSMKPYNPTFYADIIDIGTEPLDVADRAAMDYTWSVLEPDGSVSTRVEPFDNKGDSIALKIIQDENNFGKVITIRVDTVCSTITDPERQKSYDTYTYRIDDANTFGGDSLCERGKVGTVVGYHEDNQYYFDAPFYDDEIECEWYFCDVYGNRISAYDEYIPYIDITFRKGSRVSYYLSFLSDLPPDKEFYVKVIVYLDDVWTGNTFTYSRIHYIPAVTLWGETTYMYTTAWSRFDFYYHLLGYYENAWAGDDHYAPAYEYEVVDFVYDAPAGATVTASVVQTTNSSDGGRDIKTTLKGSGSFTCTGCSPNDVVLKKIVVKVNLKGYPNICTYSTVIFQ